MDIREFKRILNLGLGRAILYLREHDPAPYREAILADCLHHAMTLGAEMLKDPGYDEVEPGVKYWLKDHGGTEMPAALCQSTPRDAAVETYLTAIERELSRPKRTLSRRTDPQTGLSYAQVKERLSRNEFLSPRAMSAWGREAGEEDILQAAGDLLAIAEDDDRRLRAYLQMFHERPFPLAPARLFALARGSNEKRIAFMALGALVPLETPEVLDYARELLESGRSLYRAVPMLFKRYPAEGHAAIEALLNKDLDAEELHGAGQALRTLVERNPDPSATPALILLYEKGPCPNCREETIRLLMAMDTLPDWMAAESRYDSSEYIRRMMRLNV